MLLAMADFNSPVTWAVLIGWVLSVVLHEWAHGFAAYRGGDYTIKERGGLSLNPLQYVDPLNSLILPVVFLMMGGIPLPGGVTYVRTDLLRGRGWQTAVALAGPAMNFLIFLALAAPFHPRVGIIDPWMEVNAYQTWHVFLGAMVQLQIISVMLNLIPVPPLDGFNAIAPYMDESTRRKLLTPPMPMFAIVALFLIFANVPQASEAMFAVKNRILIALGFDYPAREMIRQCFNIAVTGRNN
jgi:Zn-dependent protease